MKKITILFCFTCCASAYSIAQVKIGNNPTVINNAALLELESNNKGLLLPRMIDADMRAILNPPKGLMVFNTTDSATYFRRDSGWIKLNTMKPCAFYAALNVNQSVPNFTYTSLFPYTKYYDQGSNFNASTGVFTAPEAGVYHFEMSIVVPPQTSNTAYAIQTSVNGSVYQQKYLIAPSFTAAFFSSLPFNFDIKLNAGDNYSFQFLQRTGATISTQGALATETTYFSGFKVF